jgi:ElaB/YqjD/DUF883 family membrane-anchored ribosome-binding protein
MPAPTQGHYGIGMKTSPRVEQLVNDVEELLAELSDEHGPEVAALRARVEETVATARRTLGEQSKSAAARALRYAKAVDNYITGYPRIGFLTGVAVGGLLVYLAGLLTPDE